MCQSLPTFVRRHFPGAPVKCKAVPHHKFRHWAVIKIKENLDLFRFLSICSVSFRFVPFRSCFVSHFTRTHFPAQNYHKRCNVTKYDKNVMQYISVTNYTPNYHFLSVPPKDFLHASFSMSHSTPQLLCIWSSDWWIDVIRIPEVTFGDTFDLSVSKTWMEILKKICGIWYYTNKFTHFLQ